MHNSLFLIAHFHNVIIGGVVFGIFAGINYWFPKAYGYTLDRFWGVVSFWFWIIGFFVQREDEGFREPVSQTCEATEDHTTDDYVMEVGNQEQAVVQHEVSTRNRQQNAGHTTHREGDDEANGPQHRCIQRDTALIHGEQPVPDCQLP